MNKKPIHSLIIFSLIMLMLTACGDQATEEPVIDTATEQPVVATEEAPTEVIPTEALEVQIYEPQEIVDGTFYLEFGSPPVIASLTNDAPSYSYMFVSSQYCQIHISVSGTSNDKNLLATLVDPSSEEVKETASLSSGDAIFVLPAKAKNNQFNNLFQVDVRLDDSQSGSSDEDQMFTIALKEVCDEDSYPIAEAGPAPQIERPVTFSTDTELWSLQYPEGWGVEVGEQSSINLANDPALLEAIKQDGFEISTGQAGLTIFFFPTSKAVEFNLGGSTTAERAFYLAALLTPESDDSLVKVGDVEFIRHEGQPLLGRIPHTYGDVYQGMTVVWDISEDTIGVAVLMLPPGSYPATERTVYGILESVQFNAPVEEILSTLSKESE